MDDANTAFDLNATLTNMGGDAALLEELARLFLSESPKLVLTLRNAIAKRDAKAIAAAAHSLKGSLGIFSARRAVNAASKMEQFADAGQLAAMNEFLGALEIEVERVRAALESLKSTGRIGDRPGSIR